MAERFKWTHEIAESISEEFGEDNNLLSDKFHEGYYTAYVSRKKYCGTSQFASREKVTAEGWNRYVDLVFLGEPEEQTLNLCRTLGWLSEVKEWHCGDGKFNAYLFYTGG